MVEVGRVVGGGWVVLEEMRFEVEVCTTGVSGEGENIERWVVGRGRDLGGEVCLVVEERDVSLELEVAWRWCVESLSISGGGKIGTGCSGGEGPKSMSRSSRLSSSNILENSETNSH